MSCLILDGNKAAVEDNLYELPVDIVKQWFGHGRFGRIGTIGDGSCFFHSVCNALDIKDYNSKEQTERREIARKLRCGLSKKFTRSNYDEIIATITGTSKSYDEIKKQLCEPAVWAEEVMIKWASRALDVNIIFLNFGDNKNSVYCGVHLPKAADAAKNSERQTVPTIVVAWIDHSHFELVVRIDAVNENVATVRRVFDPAESNDLKTIEALMMAYVKKCNV